MKIENATFIHHIEVELLIKLIGELKNEINDLKINSEPKKPTELLRQK